jgi:Fe-S-cluster containining protein
MDAALQELYDRIPAIPDCTGRCWTSCGPIDMSGRERQRIRQAGYRITPADEARTRADTYWCEALTTGKRCAVYEMRPLICRLWGVMESLPCPYGCRPEGGWLPDVVGYRLITEAWRIGGGRPDLDAATDAEVEAALGAAVKRQRLDRDLIRRRGAAGELARAEHSIPAAFRRPEGR